MPRAAPAADAKIGKKIDFVAAELGARLALLGYTRKARKLWREQGKGEERCFQVIELLGDKWNEGSSGKFAISMGVQFPGLHLHLADMMDEPWRKEYAEQPDTAMGNVRADFRDTLPAEPAAWWTPEMQAKDGWFQISAGTDLAALAARLVRGTDEYIVPWLDRHAALESMLGAKDKFGDNIAARLIVNVLLGRHDDARTQLVDIGANSPPQALFAKMKAWLASRGVDVEAAVSAPRVAVPSSRETTYEEARRQALINEAALAQDPAPIMDRLPKLLDAFHEACRTRDGANSTSPIWSLLGAADVATRREAVLFIMQQLPSASLKVPSLHPNIYGDYPSYDGYWGELVARLLKGLPCDEAFANALLERLMPLTARTFAVGMVTIDITPAWRHGVRYLCSEARLSSEALKPRVAQLLEQVRQVALANFDEDQRMMRAEAVRQGLDAATVLGDGADLRARLAAYPEQRFEKDERDAIGALRKWLHRDAAGRDVLVIEDDDWGRQLKQAMALFPADRSALVTLFEEVAAAPPAKITPAFKASSSKFLAAVDGAGDEVAEWLEQLLRSYAVSDLQHEWATTTARPGVGAFAGDTSSAILLGLIRLAQLWRPGYFASALAVVAEASLVVVEAVRMRNQKAMSAAVEALAASADGRTLLKSMREGSKKAALNKAIDAALAKASTPA